MKTLPIPPMHPGCRCIVSAVTYLENLEEIERPAKVWDPEQKKYIYKNVPGSTQYNDWFAKQPESFQRSVLGDTKFALYKDGKVTFNQFTDLRSNEILTLDQLKTRYKISAKEVNDAKLKYLQEKQKINKTKERALAIKQATEMKESLKNEIKKLEEKSSMAEGLARAKAAQIEKQRLEIVKEQELNEIGKVSGMNSATKVIFSDKTGALKKYSSEAKEEVCAYEISEMLGFNNVPITWTKQIQGQIFSFQEWKEGKTGSDISKIESFKYLEKIQLNDSYSKMVLFDSIICNQDRHWNNYLYNKGKFIAIDNGLAFYYSSADLAMMKIKYLSVSAFNDIKKQAKLWNVEEFKNYLIDKDIKVSKDININRKNIDRIVVNFKQIRNFILSSITPEDFISKFNNDERFKVS